MPAQPIDREAVKLLCKQIGLREGARRMGLSEARVLKWSQRDPAGPWKASRIVVPEHTVTVHHAVSSCPQPTKSPSQALAEALASHRDAGTLSAARAAARTLKGAEGGVIVGTASDLLAAVKAHRAAHGLDRDVSGGSGLTLSLLSAINVTVEHGQ